MTACGNWKKNACVVSKNRLLQLMYFTAFSFLYYYFPFAITKNTFTELHHEYIRCHIRNRKCLPLASHGFTLVVLWGHMGSPWLFCGVTWVHPCCFVGSHGFTLVVLWGHMGWPWLFCGVTWVDPGCFVGSHGFTLVVLWGSYCSSV
jgi:hypothetical protein